MAISNGENLLNIIQAWTAVGQGDGSPRDEDYKRQLAQEAEDVVKKIAVGGVDQALSGRF